MGKSFGDSDFWQRQAELKQQQRRVESATDSLLAANQQYALGFLQSDLAAPPRRHLAILTCMDARIDPMRMLGLQLGDAHVIRNAGGSASDDALRSLILSSNLLGTREFLVIHHTDCGMMKYDNATIRHKVEEATGQDAGGIDFLPFTDLEASVRNDVERIADSGYLPRGSEVRGFVYDVATGRLSEVCSATVS